MIMTENNTKFVPSLIVIATFLVFLDAYMIFDVPISWIGQLLLTLIALINFNQYKKIFENRVLKFVIILLVIPQIFTIFFEDFVNVDFFYLSLRYFNMLSFIIVFSFASNYEGTHKSESLKLNNLIKLFCTLYSLLVIYFFIAQIFDFYEPFRNRANTDLFEDSVQSTFWLSQPHRAMGTFREPSFLVTFFFPLVFLTTKLLKKTEVIFCLITGIALGLTRSDLIRFFSFFIFLFVLYSWYKTKKINVNLSILLFSIFLFSTYVVLECNLNPDSVECIEFEEDVEKINGSGKINIKSNSTSSLIDIGIERTNIIKYFLNSFESFNPDGFVSQNSNFQNFVSVDINNEMYLTNRTLPDYLLIRYSTENFGTGNYSFLKYPINVQNLIVFYTQTFGIIFIVLLFIFLLDFIAKNRISINTVQFIMMIIFLSISPIEEFNAYYGLLMGIFYKYATGVTADV